MSQPQSAFMAPSPEQRSHPVIAGEFLTVKLGAEEYGIEILKVQEIRGYRLDTTIANAPDYIKGVINLRGVIVPIIDLRVKLKLAEALCGEQTAIIVLNVEQRVVGVIVDGVSEVLTLTPDQIKAAPSFSSRLKMDFITGLGTVGDRMIILLNIDAVALDAPMDVVSQGPKDVTGAGATAASGAHLPMELENGILAHDSSPLARHH